MKLSEYLPEVPALAGQMSDFNNQLEFLQLMKSSGDVGQAPTIGLDHIVNTWVRHQMAYRQQLIQDLMMVAYSCEEIRGPLNHITSEVFRRGIEFVPSVEKPDPHQLDRLKAFLSDCNVFDQSLEEVLRQFHFDVNCVDDGFLYIAKEYHVGEDKKLRSKVKEIRRLNPALVEFDLDSAGLPKNAHYMCAIHRDDIQEDPITCPTPDCEQECQPVMYKYYHRNKHIYLFDSEIIHVSKFSPSETYGWSPILTIFEKALTIIGMDKNLFRYFFERKMPASMLMVFTDDPESLRRERQNIAAQTRVDPNYVPMIAVSSRNQRGRVEMVRLFHTLQEMDYLPVRNEIRERIAAMWGVTPAWQGAPEAFGGLSTQTQQLVVMSRVVEGDQRLLHDKVFPQLLKAFNITDYTLRMPNPEEKAEATRISFAQQRAQVASMYLQLGYEVKLKDDDVPLDQAEFIISGKAVPMAEMQGEQMALTVQQMKEQSEMQQEQMNEVANQQGQPTGINPAEGRTGMAPAGAEGMPLQMMWDEITKSKFNGRTGGVTPDWMDKNPFEERDIDEFAAKYGQKKANRPDELALTIDKSWLGGLHNKGFVSAIIKDITSDGKQLWFINEGVDYVASLGSAGILDVEKAKFEDRTKRPKEAPERPGINYNPTELQHGLDDAD